jgi:hypothetical protein
VRWIVVIAVLAACSRIESSGPPTEQQLATACIKYAVCSQQSVRTCIDQSIYADASVTVYRPEGIRCMVAAGASCAEILSCVDDTCLAACPGGPCETPGEEKCRGAHLESCGFDKQLLSYDCGVFDETCKVSPEGYRYCGAPNGTPCPQPGIWCQGDTLVDCNGGEEHRMPCGRLFSSGKCLDRRLQCGYGDECFVEQQPVCDGNVVQLCSLGKNVDVDCVQLGFAGCFNGACVPN